MEHSEEPVHHLLWAKTGPEDRTHPLICHLVDVGQVGRALWKEALGQGLRRHMATSLGLGEDDAARVIAFWIALHDLGKASPAFQRLYAPAVSGLTQAGLRFPQALGGFGIKPSRAPLVRRPQTPGAQSGLT